MDPLAVRVASRFVSADVGNEKTALVATLRLRVAAVKQALAANDIIALSKFVGATDGAPDASYVAAGYGYLVATMHALEGISASSGEQQRGGPVVAELPRMSKVCAGWEVVCPDGLVRSFPYHNLGDAESHVKHANDPNWFAERRCRLAPKPSRLELSQPPCSGGEHKVRPILVEHAAIERGIA